MGVFDKFDKKDIDAAEGFNKTPNMNDAGKYLVRVRRHSIGASQRNKNHIKFVCEYEIEETTSVRHPKGAQRSFVIMIDPGQEDKAKSKLGAIKAHLEAVSRTSQSEIDQGFLNNLEANPFKFDGVRVWLEVGEVIQIGKGKDTHDFTPQNWYPYEEEDSEDEEDESLDELPF